MEKKEYLNEENYQKVKGKISVVAFIVLIVGLVIGGMLIVNSIKINNDVNVAYSETTKINIIEKIQQEENLLKLKKIAIEAKGIKYSSFAKYTDGEAYDLKIITNVMDPSFDYWKFDEYKNNSITKNYCLLKAQLEDFDSDFNKRMDSSESIQYFIGGIAVIIFSCMIAGLIYIITKRREIMAFSAQQMRPIVEEGMEKMAPTVGKVGKEVMKEMSPAVGELVKEIAKGIKEGMKDEEK